MGDKREPKGGESYEDELASLVGGMKFNEKPSRYSRQIWEELRNDVFNGREKLMGELFEDEDKQNEFFKASDGESRSPCGTPGSYIGRRTAIAKHKNAKNKNLLNKFKDAAAQEAVAGRYSPTTADLKLSPRKMKASKISLGKTKKDCTTEFDLNAHASSGALTPSGDRSELRQVVDERQAGGNSDDVNELARAMARANQRTGKLLGSELGQPKVW